MSLLKYIDRMKRMDQLIRMKATGNSREFAEKMGLSRSVLMDNLSEMKTMGAPISYCTIRQSYYYESDCRLVIDFTDSKLKRVKGGRNILGFLGESDNTGLEEFKFSV